MTWYKTGKNAEEHVNKKGGMTDNQWRFIIKMAEKIGLSMADLRQDCIKLTGQSLTKLDKQQAGKVIEHLKPQFDNAIDPGDYDDEPDLR